MSGAENGVEQAENRMSRSGVVSEHSRKCLSGSVEQEAEKQERHGEWAKSAAYSPLTPKRFSDSAIS